MTLVIHLGTGKTGTTYLQDIVFPELCERKCIKFNPPIFDELFKILSPNNFTEFRKNLNHLENNEFSDYKNDLEAYIKNNKNIFLSAESFSSLGFQLNMFLSRKILDYFIPSFSAIIVFRKHNDFLYSLYRQAILQGNIIEYDQFLCKSKVNFNNAFNQRFNLLNPKVDISNFNYQNIIDDIEKLNNCENIYIYNYDDFKLSNKDFISDVFDNVIKTKLNEEDLRLISRLLKIPRTNVSININAISLILKLNRILPFDKFMLYSTDTFLNKKNIIYPFLIKKIYKFIPNFILRLFTWRAIRKLLKLKITKRVIPNSNLKTEIYSYINQFEESYKLDFKLLSKRFVFFRKN